MDLEEIGADRPQQAGYQHSQGGPGDGSGRPPVKAIDQRENEHRQHQRNGQPDEDGIVTLEVEGDEHFPQHQNGEHKGGNGPQTGLAREENEQQGEGGGQGGLLVQPVVVGHGDGQDLVPPVADDHQGPVTGGKDLVLFQRAVEQVVALDGPAPKFAAQQLQGAHLLAGADQTGVEDGAVVGGEHPGGAAVGPLIDEGPFKPGGQGQQQGDEDQADNYRGVIAQALLIVQQGHIGGVPFL